MFQVYSRRGVLVTSFQVEQVEDWQRDATELIYAHWQELGLDLDLEIAPDFEKMKVLENMGMFKVITAREDGVLVGYLLALISEHLHYRTSPKVLIVDAYYVAPESRVGTGVKLFRFMETLAKESGCIKIYASTKVHQDHSKFFDALGYRLSDTAHTKRI
jgi:N-acetylglutamate synthase-like GNAT family acetyltransferase